MKSAISISASLFILAASVARGGEPGTYEYQTYDNVVTITGYEPDDSSELVDPAELDGLPVTSIGWEAFRDCVDVASIVLPEDVTSIGGRAFFNCRSLASVTMPPGLANIGEGVFFNCRSLVEVTIPDSVTSIGNGAFFGTGLTSISIPSGVTDIGAFALARCAALDAIHVQPGSEHFASVDGVLFDAALTTLYRCPEGKSGGYSIPEGVTAISGRPCSWWCYPDEGAFENCALLDSVTLPDSVMSIGARTFRGCDAVASLFVPIQVNEIDASAFDDRTALTSIDVVPQNLSYSSIEGVLLSGDGTELVRYPEARAGHFNVPAGITVLRRGAFTNCAALTSINIPEGVAAIQYNVFTACDALERVHLPASLTEVNSAAFSDCPRLTAIEVADGSPSYQSVDGLLYSADATELRLCPPGRSGAFAIPKGVTAIAGGAFSGCQQLTGVLIPASVETLNPRRVFSGCGSLESIDVAEENESFASVDGALYDREITSILFCPRGKTGSYAVAEGVETVSWPAFNRCVSLTEVVLPQTLTSIGSQAFLGCSALSKIRIPDSVAEIGYGAFRACSSLVEINIPRNLRSLPATRTTRASTACSSTWMAPL